MPKGWRRKSSKDSEDSLTGQNEGSHVEEGRAAGKASEAADDLIQKAARSVPPSARAAPPAMDASRVPQVTITAEGGCSSREVKHDDWDDAVDGTLRRKLSNSSISSTGSSTVESEDDLLSDTESNGIITLEPLVDTGEVSRPIRTVRGPIEGVP